LCPNRGAEENKDAGCEDYEPARIASDGGRPLLIYLYMPGMLYVRYICHAAADSQNKF
jgi:hypothetical protein